MQIRWITRLLDLVVPVPRVLLLHEVGFVCRLSTTVLRAALAMSARLDLLPGTHLGVAVFAVAKTHITTWAAVIGAYRQEYSIPDILAWLVGEAGLPTDERTPTAIKRIVKTYLRKCVDPALSVAEEKWRSAELAKPPRRGSSSLHDYIEMGLGLMESRPWCQLRLQRRLTIHGRDLASACPLCGSSAGVTAEHLLEECLVAKSEWGVSSSQQMTDMGSEGSHVVHRCGALAAAVRLAAARGAHSDVTVSGPCRVASEAAPPGASHGAQAPAPLEVPVNTGTASQLPRGVLEDHRVSTGDVPA